MWKTKVDNKKTTNITKQQIFRLGAEKFPGKRVIVLTSFLI